MGNKRRLELRIPVMLYNKIAEKAKFQGKTINALCVEIFWKYFDKD